MSEIEDNFSQHFVASNGCTESSSSSSSPPSSLPFLPSSSSDFLARLPSSSPHPTISPRPLLRSHISPLEDEDPECQMREHSIEHSSENSTRRQSEHFPRYKTKAFAAKRKHSKAKQEEEEEEEEGADEEESEVDPDGKSAMRVDHHPSRAAGAIESLLHQHVTLFKPGFSNRIHCRGISISNFQLSIVCVSNTRATIYICGKAELYTFGQLIKVSQSKPF